MLNRFFFFLRHPNLNEEPESLNGIKSIQLILKSFVLYLGMATIMTLLFPLILKQFNLFPEVSKSISDIPLSLKLLFFVPIYEEVAFRLPLRFSRYNLFLSLATFQFLFFYHTFNLYLLISISILIAIVPVLGIIPTSFYSKMEWIWKKYFPFIYYGLALSFGILHMFNFNNITLIHFLFFPLIVSNQIVMGLLLGYVRVTFKNGFIYSVLIHLLINLPFLLIAHL